MAISPAVVRHLAIGSGIVAGGAASGLIASADDEVPVGRALKLGVGIGATAALAIGIGHAGNSHRLLMQTSRRADMLPDQIQSLRTKVSMGTADSVDAQKSITSFEASLPRAASERQTAELGISHGVAVALPGSLGLLALGATR